MKCPICKSLGHILHENVMDYYFGTDGVGNIIKCENIKCGVVWLFPQPTFEELGKYYENYYTHNSGGVKYNARKKLISLITKEQVNPKILSNTDKVFYYFLVFLGITRKYKEDAYYTVGGVQPFGQSRLLDVGCGNGERMDIFSQVGWSTVSGIDFDAEAVKSARLCKRNVKEGGINDIPFLDNSYEYIFLHHVVEHVSNLVSGLQECRRVLVTGGKICIITPNAESMLHTRYGKYWRGLEVPRHLILYTVRSLSTIFEDIGFKIEEIYSINRSKVWMENECKKIANKYDRLNEEQKHYEDNGEEIYLIATKK